MSTSRSIISQTIPNLVNGVSQQPYALRLASQAEIQINAHSSVVEGLRKRPPTRHSAKILNTPLDNAYCHTINRDVNERYTIVATNGDLRVFRLDGSEVAVNFPNGKAYLANTDPREGFAAVTVADYTFFLNKAITVAKAPDITGSRPHEALIWVRQGAYSTTYSLNVHGAAVSYKTNDAVDASSGAGITTSFIAQELANRLVGAGVNGQNGWVIAVLGSTIYLAHDTANFVVSATDGIGDTAVKVVRGDVQRFSDLPAKAVGGFRARIAGTNDNTFDDYWVEYLASAQNPQGGTWRESMKGGEHLRIAAHTMPHVLVRETNGTFTFRPEVWKDRAVGDTDSVPFPSFLDRKINDIFFHRNRLGFLADENVVFSRAGEFTNFFKASAIQTVDTDPIDVAVSHVKVSILRHAIPFNETLLLFSDQTQFTIGQGDILTPQTISINQTTEYECSLRAKPVGAGRHVYFAVQRGQFTGIREYYVEADSNASDATDVTAHVPRYVPQDVVKLEASSNEDILIALSAKEANSLYVYRWYFEGGEKHQSAWYRWDFGDCRILNCSFIESDVWMVVARADGVFIEHVSLEPGRVDAPSSMLVHLDRRLDDLDVQATYDAVSNTTSFDIPYELNGETYQVVAWHGNVEKAYRPGKLVPFTVSGRKITVPGTLTKFFFGRQYAMRYRFSKLMIREEAMGGGGFQPIGMGRIQVRKMAMTFNNTGYFRVEVTPAQRDTYTYTFSGRVVGSGKNIIGTISLEEGRFSFPVAARNEEVDISIVNDSFLPCGFLSAEWEAFHSIRSVRI
jgi:hypothetical protein